MDGATESPLEPSPRRSLLTVIGITALGLALRLWGLGDESFWADEGWTWWAVRGGLAESFQGMVQADFHPPLYYLLLWGWSRLGDGEAWLRLPSALFGAACIPLLFRLGRRWLGWRTAWGAALLLALSANATYFSQEARSYSLVLLLTLAAANLVESSIRGRAAWLGIVLGLTGLTHYIAGFFAIVVAIWLLRRREHRTLVISTIVAMATFAPWAPFFLQQFGRAAAGFWIPLPSPREVVNLVLEWSLFPHYVPPTPRWAVGAAGFIVLIAVLGGMWASRRRQPGRFASLWATLPIAISIVASLRVSIFYPRSMIYVIPAWLLLAASWSGRAFVPAVAAVAATFVGAQGILHFSIQKENWRDAVAYTASNGHAPHAFWPGDLEAPGTYYLRHRPGPLTLFRLPPDDRVDRADQREELGRLVDPLHGPDQVWLLTRYKRKHVGPADFAKFEAAFQPTGIDREFRSVRVELWTRRALPLKVGTGGASPGASDHRFRTTPFSAPGGG